MDILYCSLILNSVDEEQYYNSDNLIIRATKLVIFHSPSLFTLHINLSSFYTANNSALSYFQDFLCVFESTSAEYENASLYQFSFFVINQCWISKHTFKSEVKTVIICRGDWLYRLFNYLSEDLKLPLVPPDYHSVFFSNILSSQ